MGESRLPGIAADDLGKIAYTIFRRGSDFIGRTVGVYSEALTVREMADALSRHLDLEPIRYNAIDPDRYRASGLPMADEVGNMFHVYRDFAPAIISARSRTLARDLNPQLKTFRDWIIAVRDRILGVLAPESPPLR